jgi:hypothetical protein
VNTISVQVTQTCFQINEKMPYYKNGINSYFRLVLTCKCGINKKWCFQAGSKLRVDRHNKES